MKHLANISQFEGLQNSAPVQYKHFVWNDDRPIPDSYRNLGPNSGLGRVMGDERSTQKPNEPSLPAWGARNSLGDILMSLQDRLTKYLRDTKKETDSFAEDIKSKTHEIGVFLDVIKHPAARRRLGFGKKEFKGLSNVVRDFYSVFQKQIYNAIYQPLADSCNTVEDAIKSKSSDVPSRIDGLTLFGLFPTLRSKYKARIDDAWRKGDIDTRQWIGKRLGRRSRDMDWQEELGEYNKYYTWAHEMLKKQREGGAVPPELKKIMEAYGFDASGYKRNKQGETITDALRAVLGDFADAAASNDFFSTLGTPEWANQHRGLLGRLRSQIPHGFRTGTKGREPKSSSDKNQTSTSQKDKAEYRDTAFDSTFNPADYATAADLIKAQGFEKTQAFVDGVDAAKSRKERVSQDQWKLYQRVAKAVKSDPRYHKQEGKA